jgi:hypothetical protein
MHGMEFGFTSSHFSMGYVLRWIWHLASLGSSKTHKGPWPLTKSVGFCTQWEDLSSFPFFFSCSSMGLPSSTRMAFGISPALEISWILTLLSQSNKLSRVPTITTQASPPYDAPLLLSCFHRLVQMLSLGVVCRSPGSRCAIVLFIVDLALWVIKYVLSVEPFHYAAAKRDCINDL